MATSLPTNFSSTTTAPTSSGSIPLEFTVAEITVAAIALLIIMIACLVGNSIICFVVFRNRRMWTEMNMFIVNLALGDIAMSLLSMTTPLDAAFTRQWSFGRGPICHLNAFCNSVLFCNTIFTHTAISIDRFFAVVKPMKKIMTKKKALSVLLTVWAISVFISLGPILGWGYNDYNGTTVQCGFGFPRSRAESLYIVCLAICAFLVPIVIMSFVYIKIYWVVKHHTRRISTSTFGNYQQAAIEQQRKTVLTFFLALIAFIICWTPFFVFIAFAVAISSRDEIPHGLGIAAYWCGFLNSALNPYLIGLRSERFREAFKRVFCFCFIPCRHISNRQKSDKSSFCADTKNRSMLQPTTIQENSQRNNGFVVNSNSLTNVDGINTSKDHQQKAVQQSSEPTPLANNNENRVRRTGRQENVDKFIYQHYIHLVQGKLWNEATV